MLLFGHIGITIALVKACEVLASRIEYDCSDTSRTGLKAGSAAQGVRLRIRCSVGKVRSRIGAIDYRLVLLGSILPDIIDKPVWFLVSNISAESVLGGRGYAHTLAFNLVLLLGGLVLIKYRKRWLLVLSLCSLGHLVCDQMWGSPATLLWPFLGPLPAKETAGWLSDVIRDLFTDPDSGIPEIVGLLALLFLLPAYRLVTKKGVVAFLSDGTLG